MRGEDLYGLDVLHDASVHGLLETWVLTSKVLVAALSLSAAGLAGGVGGHGGVEGIAHGLVRGGQEDDLAVGRLGHGLHGLEVSDLHGGSRAEDVGSLTHKLGGFDLVLLAGVGVSGNTVTYLSLGGNDLAFTDTLALSGHGERLLQLLAENNVLDEHALDLNTPSSGDILNDLSNRLGNLLSTLDNILKNTSTNDMTKCGLGTLHQGLANVVDAEGSLVGSHDVVVDDRGEAEGDVVLGHANLLGDLCGLNLDIDLDDLLAEGVNVDQAGVDGLVELSKLGDETDVALVDFLVGVGAEDAARDGAQRSDGNAKSIPCKQSVWRGFVMRLLKATYSSGRTSHRG